MNKGWRQAVHEMKIRENCISNEFYLSFQIEFEII
jgi:hypothetical protein